MADDAVVPDSPQLPPRQRTTPEHLLMSTEDAAGREDFKKKSSTISRLLRTVNLRRSGRKYTYKQHEGDLSASEMTMSDEDRMQLMILVKEGKISMHQAVDAVKQFEAERRQMSMERDSSEDQGISTESVTSDEVSHTPETSSLGEESPSPSVCRSPELPPRNPDLQPAGSHGARKVDASSSSKSRSTKLFSSPSGSPRKHSLGKTPESGVTPSPKDKKRGIFSSPFARRKSSDTKKDGVKPQTVERSPQSPRRGIAGILSRSRDGSLPRHALPPLPPLPPTSSRSGGAIVQSSSFQYQQGERGRTTSPLQGCRRSSESHIPLPPRSPGAPRKSQPPVYRHPYDYENIKYLSRSDTDLGRNGRLVEMSPRLVQIEVQSKASGSDSGLYYPPLTAAPPVPPRHHPDAHIFTCEAEIHLCDTAALRAGSHPELAPDPADPAMWARSPKRHTPPSGTPPDSQSPKRLHVYMQNTYADGNIDPTTSDPSSKDAERTLRASEHSSPQSSKMGGSSMEGSPVSTMEKDDPTRGSQLSSSSTMSLGSDPSPTATMEGHPVKSHSRLSQIPRRRASSFSTGDEAMSSDSEVGGTQKEARRGHASKGSGRASEGRGRAKQREAVVVNGSHKASSSMESVHASHAVSTSSSHSSVSMEEEGQGVIGRCRALRDSSPSLDGRDLLCFKKGEIIDILSQDGGGLVTGTVHNKKGMVRLTDVEILPFDPGCQTVGRKRQIRMRKSSRRPKPTTVEELLERLDLQSFVKTFLQNGFDTLELFSQLEEEDLNELQIIDAEARTKLLTAAQMLLDNVQNSLDDSSSVSGMSNQSSSQSPIPLVPCDVPNGISIATMPGARESVSSVEEGTLKKEDTCVSQTSHMNDFCAKQGALIVCDNTRTDSEQDAVATVPCTQTHFSVSLMPRPRSSAQGVSQEIITMTTTTTNSSSAPPPPSSISHHHNGVSISSTDQGPPVTGVQHISRSISDSVKQRHSVAGRESVQSSRTASSCEELSHRRSSSVGPAPASFQTSVPHTDNNILVISQKSKKTQVTQSPAMRTFSPKKSQVPTFMGRSSSPRRQTSVSPKVARANKASRPSVPERTVSLVESSSCPTTPVKLRDVSTQHGGGNGGGARVRSSSPSPASSPPEQLVCANAVANNSKVKTAHVRQIASARNGSVINSGQTPPPSPARSKLPKSKGARPPVSRHDSLGGRQKVRRVSAGLEAVVAGRLEEEMIDLTQPPYTDQLGFCGIPPALVERYAEELQLEIWEAAQALDNCRLRTLQQQGRKGVHSDMLAELTQTKEHQVDTTSLPDFLTSLGLPMYLQPLITSDITTLPQLHQASAAQLQQSHIHSEAHLHRLLVGIEKTRGKGSRKGQKGSASHVMTVSTATRVVDRV